MPLRYLQRHDADRLSWDTLIDRGRSLPKPSKACAGEWRSSGKDRRVRWGTARYWCLDSLNGRAYKPQGIAGSATAGSYLIEGRLARDRNLILVSWYSPRSESGLFARNRAGQDVTRLTVIDLDRERYNHVELVRRDGRTGLQNLDSHGSGVAWAGQYLYTSSKSVLWMFNADDLVEIDGRFVLPAVARWSVAGNGGLSSISIDATTRPARLNTIEFTTAGKTALQSFALDAEGRLLSGSSRTSGLRLRNVYGAPGSAVHSISTVTVPGTNFQGVARLGPYAFANSSALKLRGTRGHVDVTVVLRGNTVVDRIRMPRENVESIYLDPFRDRYLTITEHRRQFLFSLPTSELLRVAEG